MLKDDTVPSSGTILVVPAIDLLGGRPVRLEQGDFGRQSHYEFSAIEAAQQLEQWGARWLHIVDLDAARGTGDNRAVIESIRRQTGCRLQVGGGVRRVEDAEALLQLGIERIVVGSALAEDPRLPTHWHSRIGDHLVAGIDSSGGTVRTHGWLRGAALGDIALAALVAGQPVQGIVFTSIERDGTFAGPATQRSSEVAAASQLPLIVSGGIAAAADVDAVAAAGGTVAGAIIGKAWSEARIDLAELFERYDQRAAEDGW